MRAIEFQTWARDVAFPFWLRFGVDSACGGFHERLGFDLVPTEEPRRARLVSRQIYCFLIAHSIDVVGARDAALSGVEFLRNFLLRRDGEVSISVDLQTLRTDERFDLYDNAFVLFALASGARLLPSQVDWNGMAAKVLVALERHRHAEIGFAETLPLRANPHMHLLEASLAWERTSTDACWRELSDELVHLCLSRLSGGVHGAISEFFDEHWQPPLQGAVFEPGHQFEWAWLLMQWATLRGNRAVFDKGRKLIEFAETYGIRSYDGVSVAINTLAADATASDAGAKLWPQTERLKALTYLDRHSWATAADRELVATRLPRACSALGAYLDVLPRGLWREAMSPDGWDAGLVKASSLYHIVGAIEAMGE